MHVCMYLSMFAYMNVYNMHLCLKECMCYLVQVMSNSDYRKVSDNQPMIGLNGPGKTLPCLHTNPLLLLLSSRETSGIYIVLVLRVCMFVFIYVCSVVTNKCTVATMFLFIID